MTMFSWRRYTGSRIVELGGQWREAIPPPSNLFCPTLPLRHSLLIHFSSPTNSSALTLRDEDLNLVIEGPADDNVLMATLHWFPNCRAREPVARSYSPTIQPILPKNSSVPAALIHLFSPTNSSA